MKHKGQTSLVLILLAAVALIFLAVTLNWGRIAPIKTQTTVAAANAAISSASNFASYGQKKIASDLGGRWKYCQHSNIIMAVLTVVIAVVATVLTVITGGAAAPLLYFALALSAASLGLQVLVVQPGLTKLYNKMQTSLSAESQFVENGLITALQGIVSDNGQVTDYFDQNTNGRFGIGSNGKPKDTTSRFGFFYIERLKHLQPAPVPGIPEFQDGLREMSIDNSDGPKIFDQCANTSLPQCNPCCVPKEIDNPHYDPNDPNSQPKARVRPINCEDEDKEIPDQCQNGPFASQPFVYDPYFENYENNGTVPLSLRERFGDDDDNRLYKKDPNGPNNRPQIPDPGADFVAEDATGYYPSDQRKGIFALFGSMLKMERDPDGDHAPVAPDARVSDKVTPIPGYHADDNECAQNKINADPNGFWWKPGDDNFCSTQWPYNINCPGKDPSCSSHQSCAGQCQPGAGAVNWPDDVLDDIVYGLGEFDAWAASVAGRSPQVLQSSLDQWYPDAARWIAPACSGNLSHGGAFADDPDICNCAEVDPATGRCAHGQEGYLHGWRRLMGGSDGNQGWYQLTDDWLNRADFVDTNAWCLPPENAASMTQQEKDAINAAGPWGSLGSVIACFDYNKTNDARFQQCRTDLDALDCSVSACGIDNINPCDGSAGRTADGKKDDLSKMTRCDMGKCEDCHGRVECKDCVDNCTGCQDGTAKPCTGCTNTCNGCCDETCTACQKNNDDYAALEQCISELDAVSCPGMPPSCSNAPRSLAGAPPAFDPCDSPSNYKTWVGQSYDGANGDGTGHGGALAQKPRFERRGALLTNIKDRAEKARDTFKAGYNKLDKFLGPCDGPNDSSCSSPAYKLMRARQTHYTPVKSFPNYIIYGWQGAKDSENRGGYWHIARAEVMMPTKCDAGKCDVGRFDRPGHWIIEHPTELPKMNTYQKKSKAGWLLPFVKTLRCYELIQHTGKVLVRVTRWDEERRGTFFASHQGNDLAQRCGGGNKGGIIGNTWTQLRSAGLATGSPDEKALNSAFMLFGGPEENSGCRAAAETLLSQGVKSTTCAQYFLLDTKNGHVSKFDTKWAIFGGILAGFLGGGVEEQYGYMDLKFDSCPANAFNENQTTVVQ